MQGLRILSYKRQQFIVQGFPAQRKAVTIHVEKYDIFSCVLYHQSAAETSLAFRETRSG